MKVLIAYYSLTGNTEKFSKILEEEFSKKHDVNRIKLEPLKSYSKIKAYLFGVPKAIKGGKDDLKKTEFDWSDYDVILVGTPVWAGKPTPVINGYFSKVKSGANKKVFGFATHQGRLGSTAKNLEELTDEHNALFLDFGEIKVGRKWGENAEKNAKKISKEFFLFLKEMPKKREDDISKMRSLD